MKTTNPMITKNIRIKQDREDDAERAVLIIRENRKKYGSFREKWIKNDCNRKFRT